MKAINQKYQSIVNKCVSWLEKYNEYNTQRDIADGNGDEKLFNKWDRKCVNAYDKYLDYADELPKRELEQIEQSDLY